MEVAMTRTIRFSPFFLAVALSPAFFQASLTCEKTGNTRLASFELEAGGQNRVTAFDSDVRSYDVVTGGTAPLIVRATSEDPAAIVSWNMEGSGGSIGVGGGMVILDWPGNNEELFIFVKAPGGASASYEFVIDPICTLGSCNDGDPCTNDACNTMYAYCEFFPKADGDACDPGVPGPYECNSGVCEPLGCINDAGCDDSKVCTVDTCTIETGDCNLSALPTTTPCGPGGGPSGVDPADQGLCDVAGVCQPSHACADDLDCSDPPQAPAEAQCTSNFCDDTGFASVCDFANDADGTPCTLSGGGNGLCESGACAACTETSTQDPDCTPAECGDGTLNPTAGEACDDGNLINDDGCNDDCSVGLVACDITAAACGSGEGCYPTASGDWCLPAGTLTEGAVCAVVNGCEAGLGCVLVPADPANTYCRELCDADFSIACGGGDACIDLTGGEMGACILDTCDLFAPTCLAGAGCYPSSAYGNVCWFAGSLLPGAPCMNLTDCVAGSVCASLNGDPDTYCFEMCDDISAPMCSGATVCTDQPLIPEFDACL